jgi:hypothetical protein
MSKPDKAHVQPDKKRDADHAKYAALLARGARWLGRSEDPKSRLFTQAPGDVLPRTAVRKKLMLHGTAIDVTALQGSMAA